MKKEVEGVGKHYVFTVFLKHLQFRKSARVGYTRQAGTAVVPAKMGANFIVHFRSRSRASREVHKRRRATEDMVKKFMRDSFPEQPPDVMVNKIVRDSLPTPTVS